MTNSPSRTDLQLIPHHDPPQEAESVLSSVIYDLSQQVQMAMENMLKMINEIDSTAAGVMEELEKSKELALDRRRVLEEEKEQCQKAAYTVLDMLNNRE